VHVRLPSCICGVLLAMSTLAHGNPPGIDALAWMAGPWRGSVGDRTVEENWRRPTADTLATMALLTDAGGVNMVELIVIRAHDGTLTLHLRQFSPALELRLEQNMPLAELGDRSVTFTADGAPIRQLGYRLVADDLMNVELTFADGTRITAEFTRG
jgi:hypothetical protein